MSFVDRLLFQCVIYLSELRSSTVRVILLHLSKDVVNLSSKRIRIFLSLFVFM